MSTDRYNIFSQMKDHEKCDSVSSNKKRALIGKIGV
jgi:hypothetical protein